MLRFCHTDRQPFYLRLAGKSPFLLVYTYKLEHAMSQVYAFLIFNTSIGRDRLQALVLTENGPESPRLSKRGMNGPTFWGVMGWGPALAWRQFVRPTEPPPYPRYSRRVPEYAQ